jgi:hypothetical protein
MEVKNKTTRKKRSQRVKAYIRARKQTDTFVSLSKEFAWLAEVLCVSRKTIEKDYYE